MKIEVGSTWVDDEDISINLVVRGVEENEGFYRVRYQKYSDIFCVGTDSCRKDEFLTKNTPKNINEYNRGFKEGYNQAYGELHSSVSEREHDLQKKAWNDGYNQACKEFAEEDDEFWDDEESSEYKFGAVEDDEEEYCFSKELERVLNGAFVIDTEPASNTKEDLVNNPSHYNSDPSGVKCIEITRHRNNNIGNVIKYVWRNGLKDGNSDIQDLEKAAWYLNDEIKRLKGLENGLG